MAWCRLVFVREDETRDVKGERERGGRAVIGTHTSFRLVSRFERCFVVEYEAIT